jgi:hypothetical protein
MVIGVFRGPQPDTCRGTGISNIEFRDGKLNVAYTDWVPGPGVVCGMAITYPWHLVVTKRSDAPVEFIKEIRAR